MHELIEGLGKVEVVTDDFVDIGFGDTMQEAAANLDDKNLGGHIPYIMCFNIIMLKLRKSF